jgi:plastocyanin
VAAGSTIQWTNLDQGIQHTATSDSVPSGAPTFDSEPLSYQEDFTYTVDTPGRYVYHCTVHPGQMAHAVIIAQ